MSKKQFTPYRDFGGLFNKAYIGIAAALVVILGVTGWYFLAGHTTKPIAPSTASKTTSTSNSGTKTAATKDQEIAASDAFLKSKVGTANFSKLYSREPGRDGFYNTQDSTYDFVAYHFKPILDYNYAGGTDTSVNIIFVQVNRYDLHDTTTDYAPDCVKDASQCNFAVTRQKAMDIAKQQGLVNTSQVYVYKATPLRIAVTDCDAKKDVIIDYSSGKVVKTQADTTCNTPFN